MSSRNPAGKEIGPLVRDQRCALHAYEALDQVPEERRGEYKLVVNDLGANILRSGLCAALAALERQKDQRSQLALEHVASAGLPGLEAATAADLFARVRQLDVDAYLIATREALRTATWLKRAAQAVESRTTERA